MRSMTGFGAGTAENADWRVTVTIHSVNHKRLDLRLLMPQMLRPYEVELRHQFSEKIMRGNVTIEVSLEALTRGQSHWTINETLLATVQDFLQKQVSQGELTRGEWLELLQIPHVLEEKNLEFSDDDAAILFQASAEALANHLQTTTTEGEKLKVDMADRLIRFKENLGILVEASPRINAKLEEKLREKLTEVSVAADYNEQRLLEELVYFINRTSIEEELVRLDSHLQKLDELFESDGPIGREADFYLQEMNREVNTCGSKINDSTGSQAVVALKTLIDALREQVQNIA
ncbi:MAG: YicC family protein [Clostridiales bacterium]|nr:YicC family protein [Clostridiales bacterium]